MTQYDPNTDPRRARPGEPTYTETVETTVVRESNTGWWIAGILGGLVLIAVIWILFANRQPATTDDALLEAQVDAIEAQSNADTAIAQGQIASAQASVDIARADAARAQAEAERAADEARAAEARAMTPPPPVVIETPAPAPVEEPVVTPPQS